MASMVQNTEWHSPDGPDAALLSVTARTTIARGLV